MDFARDNWSIHLIYSCYRTDLDWTWILNASYLFYTAEPIYSYMIGKDAPYNQVSISKNDRL